MVLGGGRTESASWYCEEGEPSQPCGYRALFSRGTQRSFSFPQVDVDDATDQGEWKGHPGQGEAVAEAASTRVLCQDLLSMDGIDQCPGEHSRTGAELAEASGVEEPSSPHSVELDHEEDEGQAAEDERQHHERLHCLQPAVLTDVTAGPRFSGGVPRAVIPQVQGLLLWESPPGLVQSGHEKQDKNEDVKGRDHQQEE